jgi:hypothetical protein
LLNSHCEQLAAKALPRICDSNSEFGIVRAPRTIWMTTRLFTYFHFRSGDHCLPAYKFSHHGVSFD